VTKKHTHKKNNFCKEESIDCSKITEQSVNFKTSYNLVYPL